MQIEASLLGMFRVETRNLHRYAVYQVHVVVVIRLQLPLEARIGSDPGPL